MPSMSSGTSRRSPRKWLLTPVTALLPLCRRAASGSLHHRLQMASRLTTQEAVMGQVIPKQHPSAAVRSHHEAVRALLAAALIAVVAVAATLVIVGNDDLDTTVSVAPKSAQLLPPGTRFDGGPYEGTRGPQSASQPPSPLSTYQPGHVDQVEVRHAALGALAADEGTRGPTSYWETSDPRSSYEPVPDQGFKARIGGPTMLPTGPSVGQQPQPEQQHPGARP